eukprot:6523960-Pyramimonas_sp.AAC.1
MRSCFTVALEGNTYKRACPIRLGVLRSRAAKVPQARSRARLLSLGAQGEQGEGGDERPQGRGRARQVRGRG